MTNLQIHDTFEVEEKSELTTVVKDDIQGSLTSDYGIRYFIITLWRKISLN